MTLWKPVVFILIIIIIGITAFFYFTKPAGTSSSAVTPATTGNVFGQPAQNTSPPDQISSPTTLVTGFYGWYLENLIRNQGFAGTDQFKSTITNWLTPNFAQNWNTLAENTGTDPVLLAQDYQNSWATNIQTTIVNQTSTSSMVLVSLGSGQQGQRVTVHLVFINGVWRISAVTPAS